ncbi:sulfur carrier protein ThiS [Desulfatitalea alkaliphila]|uniref:Sulfur carrier protein ThiS n=1 Tax=Desulfatitalea alkaliphila TaxID=2929485 RepID=A0AA41R3F5_9BACT|nr:sulfur carrier protein ThiS [Desulfatitalea alkaliphila]MCJ8502457.1 sulfur carrier protein ThiS [Desulfatitalea alkaliphila]
MQITINGQLERIAQETLEEMVRRKGLAPEHLVLEHNREVVPRERWAQVALQEGDVVELLRFVGGG